MQEDHKHQNAFLLPKESSEQAILHIVLGQEGLKSE
jgi:hypothetical protein